MKDDAISRSYLWSMIMMLPHNGDMISSEEVEEEIKDAPALDVVQPTNEGYGTVLCVKDLNEWDSRIILTEEGSKNCAVYYADAEEEDAHWIGLEYDGYADGYPVYDLWGCSKCGEEYRREGEPPCNKFLS